MDGMKWYVLHTMTGAEEFVAKAIREQSAREGVGEEVGQIIVPSEKVVEIKDGENKVVTRRSYPGYVFINLLLTERNQNMVRNIPKVTGFIGVGGKPVPLSEAEVAKILSQIETADKKPRPKYKFEKNEAVRIIEGPFQNFNGVVDEVDDKKQVLKVIVTIFGRSTPVELDFLQVEKI